MGEISIAFNLTRGAGDALSKTFLHTIHRLFALSYSSFCLESQMLASI